jgi:hypothetical protein
MPGVVQSRSPTSEPDEIVRAMTGWCSLGDGRLKVRHVETHGNPPSTERRSARLARSYTTYEGM